MGDQKKRGHKRSSSAASYSGPHSNHHNPEKDFQCWTSLSAIFGMIVPSCCGASNGGPNHITTSTKLINNISIMGNMQGAPLTSSSIVTGTIFGQRKGRVNFCVQEDPAGSPLLLLEFAMPTHLLIKEMQSGLLRITLECDKKKSIANNPLYLDDSLSTSSPLSLFSEPVWSMYCNGRKVGFAMRKTMKSDTDPAIANLMSLMQSVTTGAGVIPYRTASSNKHDVVGIVTRNAEGARAKKADAALSNILLEKENIVTSAGSDHKVNAPLREREVVDVAKMEDGDANPGDKQEQNGVNGTKDNSTNAASLLQDDLINALNINKSSKEEDELIYMRANYEKVIGSPDSAAFHMINPDRSQCQELSIFLTRS